MPGPVRLDLQDGVATVTLNRPEVLNALDSGMAEALAEATGRLEYDETVRCVVLRGAGDHFMAGGDVKLFATMAGEPPATRRETFGRLIESLEPTVLALRRLNAPVIASVRGACAGFGVSLMAACDLAIVADTTAFTLAYVKIGATVDGGGTWLLPRIIGFRRAMELALLGDRFDAATALSWGLVNRVVPAERLADETAALAARLAAGPASLGAIKRLLHQSLENDLPTQMAAEAKAFATAATTDDWAEGVTAFAQKRPARFTGR